MGIPCRHEIESRQFQRTEDALDADFEVKLGLFRQDPYSECEWHITKFQDHIWQMLDICLEALLSDVDEQFGADYRANKDSREQLVQVIRDVIAEVGE